MTPPEPRKMQRHSSTSISVSELFSTINEEFTEPELSTDRRESNISLTIDDLDIDPRDHQRSRSSVQFLPHVDHDLPSQCDTPESRQQSTDVFSALRRFTPEKSREHSDATNISEEVPSKLSSIMFWRNSTGGDGVPDQVNQPRISFSQRRHVTVRSSSSLGESDSQESNVRTVSFLSYAQIHALKRTIDHPTWRNWSLIFILIILFGPSIRDIWLPKTADDYVDVVLTIAFVFLAVDIIIRCIVDRAYFSWHVKSRGSSDMSCRVGSFMFWFDTFALMPVIYEIACINPLLRRQTTISVKLSQLGIPNSGWHTDPLKSDYELVFAIGRVGLMARFMRTFVLTHTSSSSRFLRIFHPRFWFRRSKNLKQQLSSPQRSQKNSQRGESSRTVNSQSNRSISLGDAGRQLEPCEESEHDQPEVNKPSAVRGFIVSAKNKSSNLLRKPKILTESILPRMSGSRSHVGAAMREITGQRVAIGALLAYIVTVLFSWGEVDTTNVMTMLTLFGQTSNTRIAESSVNIAHSSVIPTLFNYTRKEGNTTVLSRTYELSSGDVNDLRERETLRVIVTMEGSTVITTGLFDNSQATTAHALVELFTTFFFLIVWVVGVASFVGPVMTLVVEPIERMVRLLSMLMKDPLGYQDSPQYKMLRKEDDEVADESLWGKEVLKGMETNFLMSTILRVGSLMKVGFGSAGVEIIRNNLERGRHRDVLLLNKQGGSVSCIFLFCDIRQFTDATECLQEDVFVFTNKIAAVVHSICHSYGGSANKNIGDAFLVSWLLDDAPEREEDADDSYQPNNRNKPLFSAYHNQADKALLSVVKISMALHYDKYFTDAINESAKNRLLSKLSNRKGPIVQMGFGLHAGQAVQGAIGSQRKLDATYISESVEQAEFLESSTKKYGVPVLMSDAFYDLLDNSNKYRCRKVDQLLLLTGQDGNTYDPDEILDAKKMILYTFDMDIDALWRSPSAEDDNSQSSNSDIIEQWRSGQAAGSLKRRQSIIVRRSSMSGTRSSERSARALFAAAAAAADAKASLEKPTEKELVLPTGVRDYSERSWLEPDIRNIRRDFVSNGIIFPKFQEGLNSYFAKDWSNAKKCFELVLTQREDGPSMYFLEQMAEHNGIPPRDFVGYSLERG